MRKLHTVAALGLLLLVALACRRRVDRSSGVSITMEAGAVAVPAATVDSPEQVKARIAAKIKVLDQIAATKLPPITTRPTLKVTQPKPALDGRTNAPNAGVLAASSIPALPLDKQIQSFESTAFAWCAAWVRGTKESVDSMYTSECDKFHYVVLMRFSRRVDPKMASTTTFRGGSATGDATVFDLQTGANLGAVPFTAVNASNLEAIAGVELGRAVADLETQSAAAAQAAIDAVYGETPPK